MNTSPVSPTYAPTVADLIRILKTLPQSATWTAFDSDTLAVSYKNQDYLITTDQSYKSR